MSDPKESNDPPGPSSGFIATGVFFTVIAGIVFFFVEVSFAEEYYRQIHALPDVRVSGFFSTWTERAPVTWEMLGSITIIILMVVAVAYSILLHPLIGRGLSQIIQSLTKVVDSIYRLTGDNAWSDWHPGVSLLVGAAWPLTWIAIPVLVIAVVMGHVYRSLWRW